VIDFCPGCRGCNRPSPGVAPVLVFNPGRTESARVVARARTLDLDDLGAEIGEVLPAQGPARTRERSRTRMCESGPAMSFRRWRRGILSESPVRGDAERYI